MPPHTPRSRDRSLSVLSLLSGAVTAVAVTAVGWATAAAANDTAAKQAAEAQTLAEPAPESAAQATPTPLPTRTVVRRHVVTVVSRPSSVRVGSRPVRAATPGRPRTVTSPRPKAVAKPAPRPTTPSSGS